MTQPIQIICPHCNGNLKVAGATAGKQVRCPQCHGFIRVPNPVEAGPAAPTRWIVRTEQGKIYGPVAREELELWVQEGRVHAQCHVSPEGAQQWIWAAEMFPQITPIQPAAPIYAQPLPFHGQYGQSEKSRLVAGLLGLLLPWLGICGVQRFYTGHIGLGLLMLVTCGGCGIWQLIDVILVFAGSVRDVDGRPLRD